MYDKHKTINDKWVKAASTVSLMSNSKLVKACNS